MKKMCFAFLVLAFVFGAALVVTADTWHYDFNTPGITGLNEINPTGIPSYSVTGGSLRMNIPSRSGYGYSGYDLCDWVNRDALRFLRSGGAEAFSLETKISTSSTGSPSHTYLSGLYLFSNDGNYYNDLVFAANSTHLKIDRGNGTSTGGGTHPWTDIGSYDSLFLQVLYDGVNSYDFNYKTATGDSWSLLTSFTGFSFDQVGIITKTWYSPSPGVTADFDYLNYNYTVPIPGVLWLLGSGLLGLIGIRKKFQK